MRNIYRTVLWLAAWLVLGLPAAGFGQTLTTTSSAAAVIGPTNAVLLQSTV